MKKPTRGIALRTMLFAALGSLAVLPGGVLAGSAGETSQFAAAPAPFAVEQHEDQKILASDGTELQRFGESVALSGDTALVGTNDTHTGRSAVYVFTRSNGSWVETQKLFAADGAPGDNARFGASLAVDGTTAVIGADGAKVGSKPEQGAAYVFRKNGASWVQVAKLVAADGQTNDNFGNSVALSGNQVLVGAHKAHVNGNARGAAYLFEGSNDVWTQTQKIKGVDTRDNDAFGYRVGFSDTGIVVSAQLGGADFPGALYFFWNNEGTWIQRQKLVGETYSMFGSSLAVHGNRLVVGAPALDAEGVVYVYAELDGFWSRTHTIRSPEGEVFANFGYSLGMTGDSFVAGANAAAVNGQSWAGAGYVFTESNGDWRYVQKLVASDAGSNDSLGASAAIDGTTVLLASSSASPGGNFLQGMGYFFTAEAGTNQPAAQVAPSPLALTLQQGASRSVSLTISNAGSAALDYAVAEGGCAQPGDVAWLSLGAASGSAMPGRAAQVEVVADAATLGVGSHAGTLCVTTNDPQQASIDVPVDLTVTPPAAEPPSIAALPTVLIFSVSSGASESVALNIANHGGSDLDFTLVENAARLDPPSYQSSRARKQSGAAAIRTATLNRATGASTAGGSSAVLLADTAISQMTDNRPGDTGLSCGVFGESTADNSWWRRFYFGEHERVGARADVTSVTVSSGGMGPAGVPVTINLYTIAHSTPVDTIPTSGLTLIGSATTTIDSGLVSVRVPVFGSIDDTVGKDLVVEYHTDGVGNFQGQFFPGANATPETHPTFMSSTECELDEPVTAANLGVPDFHLTMIVDVQDAAPPECRNPSEISWLEQTPASGRVAPGSSTPVTITANATGLAAGSYSANVCIASNDPVRPVIAVPVSLTVALGGGGAPVAVLTPDALSLSVASGASRSTPLTIGNLGGSDLTYAISETAARANPPSYKNVRQPKSAAAFAGARLSQAEGPSEAGRPVFLDATMISQMQDNSPGSEGVSCGAPGVTAANSWWRRFYFSEHAQVGARADIASVTVSSGGAGPSPLPITINLYTIAHSTPVDTIPTSALVLIGTANATIESGLVSLTVPITGTVDDTAGKDLVVEYHTDGLDDGSGQFFPGANATPENHPTFVSAAQCDIAVPTRTTAIGYPNFHLTMVVELADEPAPADCRNPIDVPWLSAPQPSGTLVPGAFADVAITANAAGLAEGTYAADVCVATNDPTHALVAVPVRLTVTPAVVVDSLFCSGFESGETGACAAPPENENIVRSGPIDHAIAIDREGTSVDWIRGIVDDGELPGAHFNAYDNDAQIAFYWLGGAPDIAGVSSSDSTSDFLVLQSGAVIGPASTWSTVHNPGPARWAADVDGYLGFRFNCSSLTEPPASGICYGYVHLRTGAPRGFPATIVDYAYDKSGAAITIP
ncbi:FG-GAP repeat protein [Dokdonella sp.]|uniref:FG-GAP repeat protein n=1 Tax=Dokdonella sp. TaxID=2291710 RepID=UPI001B27A10E|nr:FG-GAP repeat protein [Dokdonella sp.]MBO9663302.1 hypothetical protein [Dokdonella sp.]